ncbi:MAG: hypothetical protein DMG42_10155 [Acidobacteria bacterium]|nr:MAG: hypothetical protein DMG42_10155 [Acidobacteriota bacterium]
MSPEINIEGTPVYLDIESLPEEGFYYLIGIRTIAGDSVVQHSFWANGPSKESRIWWEFLSKLMEIENPGVIRYGSFESVFLKHMVEKYGGPPNDSGVAKALESSINLLSVEKY